MVARGLASSQWTRWGFRDPWSTVWGRCHVIWRTGPQTLRHDSGSADCWTLGGDGGGSDDFVVTPAHIYRKKKENLYLEQNWCYKIFFYLICQYRNIMDIILNHKLINSKSHHMIGCALIFFYSKYIAVILKEDKPVLPWVQMTWVGPSQPLGRCGHREELS